MSLEASLQLESLKVLNKDKNRGRSLSPGTGPRGRSINQATSGLTMSRSVSRSKPDEYKWSITSHDPSERLRSPSRLREDSDDDNRGSSSQEDSDDSEADDSYEQSDEEIISGDELDGHGQTHAQGEEGVQELPNYAVLSKRETLQLPPSSDRMAREARKAVSLDELDALHRAMVNARETKSEIPPESKKQFDEILEELGYDKAANLASYQELDERKNKLQSYASYKKKLVSPDSGNEYTSSTEEKLDSELALQLNSTIVKSPIESDAHHQRAVRTLVRGDFFQLLKQNKDQPKTFLLCMDFSPESIYALEWAVGTVLVDGSVLYVVNVLEDTEYASANLNGDLSKAKNIATASSTLVAFSPKSTDREGIRKESVEYMTNAVLDKLKLTKLQVHVVIESLHHPIPRHLILEIIDYLTPNLVVVGSKGRSSLKGVLLGSLSNYVVTKSSVPVMVVKSKLKRMSRKKKQFSNNLSPLHIDQLRVD